MYPREHWTAGCLLTYCQVKPSQPTSVAGESVVAAGWLARLVSHRFRLGVDRFDVTASSRACVPPPYDARPKSGGNFPWTVIVNTKPAFAKAWGRPGSSLFCDLGELVKCALYYTTFIWDYLWLYSEKFGNCLGHKVDKGRKMVFLLLALLKINF